MKKLLFLIAGLFVTIAALQAQSHVYVNGYTRSNGTYVQGHYRTAPNYTRNDNWTTIGNVNPYTGSVGTLSGGYNSSYYSPSYNSSYSSYSTYSSYSSSYSTGYSSSYTPVYSASSYSSYYSTPYYYSNYSR